MIMNFQTCSPYFGMQSIMTSIYRSVVLGVAHVHRSSMSRRSSITLIRRELSGESVARSSTFQSGNGSVLGSTFIKPTDSSIGSTMLLDGMSRGLYSQDMGGKFMRLLGEHPDLSPLLRQVLPGMVTHETERTRTMDAKGRNSLLRHIILKAIQIYSSRFGSRSKTVYIFDDIQVSQSIDLVF
jgi:hypothetical protein